MKEVWGTKGFFVTMGDMGQSKKKNLTEEGKKKPSEL